MSTDLKDPLLERAELGLGDWYAEPMAVAEAEALLGRVHTVRQRALAAGRSCPACDLYELIARFWLDRPVQPLYDTLLNLRTDGRAQALLHLVYGQLRISRKLNGAPEALQRGFTQARPHLGAAEYFDVLRRHELLAELPLGDVPAPALGLQALLKEAAVIRALRGRRSGRPSGDRGDTLG